MGFRDATPIQEQAIPKILANKDLLAMAQTGTGKTAAFLLPVLHKILMSPSDKIKCLIIAPTRELALQIDRQIEAMSYGTDIASLAIYGGGDGADWTQEKLALSEGVDIVVATPGKLISHLNMGYVDFSAVEVLILEQNEREEALLKFKARQTRVLVATDVISRGIDIKDINLVINYNVPKDAEDYVHRIGRTARADTTGVAITLINEEDMYAFANIETLIESEINKLPPPPEIGKAPVWNPVYKKQRGKSHHKGGKSRHKGGKSHHKKRGNSNYKKGGKPRNFRKKSEG
ncbi:UNVERIFIED_CONTAM: hypothetical protein GTU68_010204 [Idotea baltica]|nr:hypothetical protein [Idotea baltica]